MIVDKAEDFIIPFQLKNNEGGVIDITSSSITCNIKEESVSTSNTLTKTSASSAEIEKTYSTLGLGIVKILTANTTALTKRNYYYEVTDGTNKIHGFFTLKQNTGLTITSLGINKYEIPYGTVNGVNATFVLDATPATGTLQLFVRGVKQIEGTTYNLSTATITFIAGFIPQTGDALEAYYVG